MLSKYESPKPKYESTINSWGKYKTALTQVGDKYCQIIIKEEKAKEKTPGQPFTFSEEQKKSYEKRHTLNHEMIYLGRYIKFIQLLRDSQLKTKYFLMKKSDAEIFHTVWDKLLTDVKSEDVYLSIETFGTDILKQENQDLINKIARQFRTQGYYFLLASPIPLACALAVFFCVVPLIPTALEGLIALLGFALWTGVVLLAASLILGYCKISEGNHIASEFNALQRDISAETLRDDTISFEDKSETPKITTIEMPAYKNLLISQAERHTFFNNELRNEVQEAYISVSQHIANT